jgi:hypothetical protein
MSQPVKTSSVVAAALWRDAYQKNGAIFRSFPLDALDGVTDGALEKCGVNVWMYHQNDLCDEASDFLEDMKHDDAVVSRYFQHTRGNVAFAVDETDPTRINLAFEIFEKPKNYMGLSIDAHRLGALLLTAYDRARGESRDAYLRPNRAVAPKGLLGMLEHDAQQNMKIFERVTGWAPDTAQEARINVRDITDFGAVVPDIIPDMTLDAAREQGHRFDSRIQRGPHLGGLNPN